MLSLKNPKQMFAEDMFEDKTVQVFSKKTGEYLGTIKRGEQILEFQSEEIEIKEIPISKNQLSLF